VIQRYCRHRCGDANGNHGNDQACHDRILPQAPESQPKVVPQHYRGILGNETNAVSSADMRPLFLEVKAVFTGKSANRMR
jgi:hypothetical protein